MTAGLTRGSQEYLLTALWAGLFLWLWNLTEGLAICWFYGKGQALKKGLPAVLLLSVIQGGGELLLTQVNTTLACFVPACISLIAVFFAGKNQEIRKSMEGRREQDHGSCGTKRGRAGSIWENEPAAGFYTLYIFGSYCNRCACSRTCQPFSGTGRDRAGRSHGQRQDTVLSMRRAGSYSPLQIFTHASMFLLVSALAGLFYYRKKGWIKRGSSAQIFWKTFKMALPSGIAVICLVAMSRIMSGTGQTMELADGIL